MQNFWKWFALLVAVGGGGYAVLKANSGLQQLADKPAPTAETVAATPQVAEPAATSRPLSLKVATATFSQPATKPIPTVAATRPANFTDLVPTPAEAPEAGDPFAGFEDMNAELAGETVGQSVPVQLPDEFGPEPAEPLDPSAELYAAADIQPTIAAPEPSPAEAEPVAGEVRGQSPDTMDFGSMPPRTREPAATPEPAFDMFAAQEPSAARTQPEAMPTSPAAALDQFAGQAMQSGQATIDQLGQQMAAGQEQINSGLNQFAEQAQQMGDAGRATIDDLSAAASSLPPMPGTEPNPFGDFGPPPTAAAPSSDSPYFGGDNEFAGRGATVDEPPAAMPNDFAPMPQTAGIPQPSPITPTAGNPAEFASDTPEPANFDLSPRDRRDAMSFGPTPSPQPAAAQPEMTDSFLDQPSQPRNNQFEVRSQPLAAEPTPRSTFEPEPAVARSMSDEFMGRSTIDREVSRGPVQPELQILKQAPKKASFGVPMVYQITVRNVGRSPAKNVIVEDRVPKGSRLEGTLPQGAISEGVLVWEFDEIAPNKEELIKVKVTPIASGQIGSITTVRMVAETAAETVVTAPELNLRLTGPAEAQLGEVVTYGYEIRNTGTEDAHDVMLSSVIPQGLAHSGGPDINYEVGTLKPGQTRNVPLPLRAVEEGVYTKLVTLTARGNITKKAEQPISIIKSRLEITHRGPSKRFVGSRVEFTSTVTNNSSQPLRDVRVVEGLPAGAEFISASHGGRMQAGNRSIVWMIPSLASGASRELSCIIVPKNPGNVETVVEAMSGENRAQVASNMEVVGFASLKVSTDHPNRKVAVGEQVPVRVKINNGGSATANRVGVTVTIPAHLTVREAKGPGGHRVEGDKVFFDQITRIDPNTAPEIYLLLEATAIGDTNLQLQVTSDEQRPLIHEESIGSYDDQSFTR